MQTLKYNNSKKCEYDFYQHKPNKCDFCSHDHNCRTCPLEHKLRKDMTTKVGIIMEEFVENNIYCKRCNKLSFKRLGNNTPSLDLQCTICKDNLEVKSKCLSVSTLPDDITCKGGNYEYFIDNINNKNLNLLVIIYGVNRLNKSICIREIYWITNSELRTQENIKITKNTDSTLSSISILNKNRFQKLKFNKLPLISFKTWIEKLIKQI